MSSSPRPPHVFVSGCYDLLHAGHLSFFSEALSYVNDPSATLTVSFASSETLWRHKRRKPSIPDGHKHAILSSLKMVTSVVVGTDVSTPGLDFESWFMSNKPTHLIVTSDDRYAAAKRALCAKVGAEYVVLPKTPPGVAAPAEAPPVSTSSLLSSIRAPTTVPLRVDFGGGWLDVPRYSRPGAYVVNCAVSPLVSLGDWRGYRLKSGLGGSGAHAILEGRDGVKAEVDVLGVGWQDPAVVEETGVCVWESGERPVLRFKSGGGWLRGLMGIWWTGEQHDTPGNSDNKRDYDAIEKAGERCMEAVRVEDVEGLAEGVMMSYRAQLAEGMKPLPEVDGALGYKYCGGGWGGYGLYIFESVERRDEKCQEEGWKVIEPYCKPVGAHM